MNGEELDRAIRESDEICKALGETNVYIAIGKLDAMVRQQQAQIAGLQAASNAIMEQNGRLEMSAKNTGNIMLDMAQDLARCGGFDHKGKNEVILQVIARLLAYGVNPARIYNMDEVPF